MKVDYAKIDEVNGEITVTLEEKDYADKVKKQSKRSGKNHAEPRFPSRDTFPQVSFRKNMAQP